MDGLVNAVAKSLGKDPAVARKAIGALLKFMEGQAPKELFQKVSALPGVEELIKADEHVAVPAVTDKTDGSSGISAPSSSATSSSSLLSIILGVLKAFGLWTMLKTLVSTLPVGSQGALQLMESIEDGAELTVVFRKLGINRSDCIKAVRLLVDHLTDKVDEDTVTKISERVPAVNILLGESKRELMAESKKDE